MVTLRGLHAVKFTSPCKCTKLLRGLQPLASSLRYPSSLPFQSVRVCKIYSRTPQIPRPALTPSQSAASSLGRRGTHPRLPTSYSHCQLAAGLRTLSGWEDPFDCGWFMRSHIKTWQSSAPDASWPRREGDHSTQLTAPPWPRNSSRAWPGCLVSRMRMMLESCANVAKS